MYLSTHFTLDELTASDTATRLGIDNSPPPEILTNLKLLVSYLEQIRVILGKPIRVLSGYRCEALNKAVGGSKSSYHMKGLAADLICPDYGDPLAVCRAVAKIPLGQDQIIHEFGHWCHFGIPVIGVKPRNELLTAESVDGQTVYHDGLITR